MPRLLKDIVVQVIGSEPDMKIVGVAAVVEDIDLLVRDEQADVLVFQADAADRSEPRADLLYRHRGLKVLILSEEARTADLHWLEPRLHNCTDVSPAEMVRLIRTAHRQDN